MKCLTYSWRNLFFLFLLWNLFSCQSYQSALLPVFYQSEDLKKSRTTRLLLDGLQILKINDDPFFTYSNQTLILPKGEYHLVYRVYTQGLMPILVQSTLQLRQNSYQFLGQALISGEYLFTLKERRWFGKTHAWDTKDQSLILDSSETQALTTALLNLGVDLNLSNPKSRQGE